MKASELELDCLYEKSDIGILYRYLGQTATGNYCFRRVELHTEEGWIGKTVVESEIISVYDWKDVELLFGTRVYIK